MENYCSLFDQIAPKRDKSDTMTIVSSMDRRLASEEQLDRRDNHASAHDKVQGLK
jgi:hypothetical protein